MGEGIFHPLPIYFLKLDFDIIQAAIRITVGIFEISVLRVFLIPLNGLNPISRSKDHLKDTRSKKSQRFHKNGLRFIRCPRHQPTSSPGRVGKVKAVIQGPALLALSRKLCLHWIPVNFEKPFSEEEFLDLISFRWSFDRLIGLRPFKGIENTRKTEILKMPTVMQIAAWMMSKFNFKKYMGKG